MANFKLYNTLSRKIEEVVPVNRGKIGLYICGPTVYDYAHIGHARTYINSDVLIRALRFFGFEVKVVMNITDVGHLTSDADTGEDKMEKKAKEEKKSAHDIAEFYTRDFFAMAKKLNILTADVVAKVTEHIKEQIDLVKKLEEKGFTYKTSDGIYFDTGKLKDYGKLARLDAQGLQEGARVEKNKEKRNLTDFALWKFSYENGRPFDQALDKASERRQMEWDSPWGVGFPGWHIECSAISMKYLGESFDPHDKLKAKEAQTIDVHTGGIDHIPVHHTNEIAQTEAVTGKQFVKYWFHSGHLMVEGEKMSKSLKNFYRISDLEKKGFEPLAFRYLVLTSHYRAKMNFTWKAMKAAQMAYLRLKEAVVVYKHEKERLNLSEEKMKKIELLRKKFEDAVKSDLSMPEAVAVVWEVVKSNIPSTDKYDLLVSFDEILGLGLRDARVEKVEARIPDEVYQLVDKREKFRKKQMFEEADKIRLQIEEKGYVVEDTSQGAVVRKK